MKIKSLILILLMILLLNTNVKSAPGENGAAFLKIPVGARSSGLGGAYTGISNDIYSVYYNPAGLNNIENMSVTFQHTDWLLDIKHEFLGFGYRIDEKSVFAVSGIFMDLGDEEKTIENNDGTFNSVSGKWSAEDVAVNLSYSYKYQDYIAFGITGKYVKQEIDNTEADGFAGDIGVLTGFDNDYFNMGFSVLNIGQKLKFINQKYELPLTYRLGVSYQYINVLFAGDLVKPDDNDLSVKLGVEYNYAQLLTVRTGWDSDDDLSSSGLSFGIGVKIEKFNFDYAFVPKKEFGDVHKFSLNYTF